ncbi:hypothetical protein KFE25_009070 [Diacronema lutheri]|uniref:PH domain-containing protein n=1 Tax=Diacronema lutheri TaxID=2081491 RepID=A0A8J6CFF4_DIALT|nr:hypothetical protein KFE25_009070 [Diacronema lutheri]
MRRRTASDGEYETEPGAAPQPAQALRISRVRLPTLGSASRVPALSPDPAAGAHDVPPATLRHATSFSIRPRFPKRRSMSAEVDAGALDVSSTGGAPPGAPASTAPPRRSLADRTLSLGPRSRTSANDAPPAPTSSSTGASATASRCTSVRASPERQAGATAGRADGIWSTLDDGAPRPPSPPLPRSQPNMALTGGTGPLSVQLLLPREGRTNGAVGWAEPIAVGINDPVPLRVQAEHFAGSALFLLKPPAAGQPRDFDAPHAVDFFKLAGNERSKFEIQVQGRFRPGAPPHPLSQLWLSLEIEEALTLGFLTRGICAGVLRVLKALAKGALHASWGTGPIGTQLPAGHTGPAVELPHLAVPFSAVRCVLTPDGEQPPSLGAEASVAMSRAAAARGGSGDGAQLPDAARAPPAGGGSTLTFAYNSPFLDPVLWVISGLGSLPPLSLHDILAELPIFITVYALRPAQPGMSDALHSEERKNVYFRFRVTHCAAPSAQSAGASRAPSRPASATAVRPQQLSTPSPQLTAQQPRARATPTGTMTAAAPASAHATPPAKRGDTQRASSAEAGASSAARSPGAQPGESAAVSIAPSTPAAVEQPLAAAAHTGSASPADGTSPAIAPTGTSGACGAPSGSASGGGTGGSSSLPWWLSALLEPFASVTGLGASLTGMANAAESDDDEDEGEVDGADADDGGYGSATSAGGRGSAPTGRAPLGRSHASLAPIEMDALELSLAFDTHGAEGGAGIDVEQEAAALDVLEEGDEEEDLRDEEEDDEAIDTHDDADGRLGRQRDVHGDALGGTSEATSASAGRMRRLNLGMPMLQTLRRVPIPQLRAPRRRLSVSALPSRVRFGMRRNDPRRSSADGLYGGQRTRLRAVACVRTARATFEYLLVVDSREPPGGAADGGEAHAQVGAVGGGVGLDEGHSGWVPRRFVLSPLSEIAAVVRSQPVAKAAYGASLRRTELSHAPLRRQLEALNAAFDACAEQPASAGAAIARALGNTISKAQLEFLAPRSDGGNAYGFRARHARHVLRRHRAEDEAAVGGDGGGGQSSPSPRDGAGGLSARQPADGDAGASSAPPSFVLAGPIARCEWEGYFVEEWAALTHAALVFAHRTQRAPGVRARVRRGAKEALILLAQRLERSTRRMPRAPWQPQWPSGGGAAAAVGGAGGAVDSAGRRRPPWRARFLELPLDAMLSVSALTHTDSLQIAPGLHFFCVETVGRRHYVATRSALSCAQWVRALSAGVEAARVARAGAEPPLRLLMPATLALSAPQFRPPSRVMLNQKALVWRAPYERPAPQAAQSAALLGAHSSCARAEGTAEPYARDEPADAGSAGGAPDPAGREEGDDETLTGAAARPGRAGDAAVDAAQLQPVMHAGASPPPPPPRALRPLRETAAIAARARPPPPPPLALHRPSPLDEPANASSASAFEPLPPVVPRGYPATDVHVHSAELLNAALELLGAQHRAGTIAGSRAGTARAGAGGGLVSRLAALHDGAARLKGCSLQRLSPNEHVATCLNIYHSLIVHRLVMLGPPRSHKEFSAMHANTSYEVGGEALCPLEIDQLLLRGRRTRSAPPHKPRGLGVAPHSTIGRAAQWARAKAASPSASAEREPRERPSGAKVPSSPTTLPSCSLSSACTDGASPACVLNAAPPAGGTSAGATTAPAPASVDPRISLALNTGSRSCLPFVPIFHGSTLDVMLSAYASQVLEYGTQLHEGGGAGGGALVILPKVVEWYHADFAASAALLGGAAADTLVATAGGSAQPSAAVSAVPSLDPAGADALVGVVPLLPRRLQERYVRLHALSMLGGQPIHVRYAPHDFHCHSVLTRWHPPNEVRDGFAPSGHAHTRTRSQ